MAGRMNCMSTMFDRISYGWTRIRIKDVGMYFKIYRLKEA